jgi:S-(hydroxymethyl)glutathione dehydrogenase/alcohol dehydrogenase
VKGADKFLPHLLGHEGSGVVLEVGNGVQHVQPGDHVVMHWRKGLGVESKTPLYRWKKKIVNAGFVTTFNEYAVVSGNRLTPIPKNLDLKLATLFGCVLTTGLGVITNNAKLKIGESIVVLGAGGIGLSIIQGAAMVSAFPIIAVDIYDNKLDLAAKMGATHIINSKQTDLPEEIKKILGQEGADVVVDNTGNPTMINLAYSVTSHQGRTILVGVPKVGDNITIYSLPLHFGKILTGSHGGESNPSIDIPKYIRLYDAGKLKINHLITDTFRLEKINTAINKMRNGEIAGRCMIELLDDSSNHPNLPFVQHK